MKLMKIVTKKAFDKGYQKLSPKVKLKVKQQLLLFIQDPFHPSLRNHSLKGRLIGLRSLVVTDDLRIVFRVYDSYDLVEFIDIGGHARVYG